ncbi:MAG: heme ABC exporter ATP-binding protein CcmA [Bryobacteraceae bacterium]|nr:heme ABC exporter ATP-binding protein CcmA [Bryobacteraceae bacterium]
MTALQAQGVWKYYGDFAALQQVGFAFAAGSCVALLGRNGAGKTTLLRILAGLSQASEGGVEILGGNPRQAAVRSRIGIIGHGIGVYDELSAEENLLTFARLYGVSDAAQAVDHWLERTDLARVRRGMAREFSRGMRQRLAIARAFIHRPRFLILDEPFTSLDDRAIALLQGLLRDALADGATVVLSTHQLKEALELASHVLLLNRGKLAFTGERTAEMLANPGWVYQHYGEAA